MAGTKMRAGAVLLFVIFLSGGIHAQCAHDHVISVNGNAQVPAPADVALLTLLIRSSAPLAADAVAENAKTTMDVRTALTGLGYAGSSFRITAATITKAGGPYYGPNQPAITGIEAQRYVYVFFRGDELKDERRLTEKAAATVDALVKAGASPANNPYAPQQQASVLIYALENPAEFEKQAMQKALDQARAEAQTVAEKMGVQIAGVCNVSAGATSNNVPFVGIGAGIGGLVQQAQDPLSALPYRYYSIQPDMVMVPANASVTYDFK
jgi:uncharacterized protein